MSEKEKLELPPHLTEDRLRRFVLDVCDGQVMLMTQLPMDLVPMVFMPIALGAVAGYSPEELGQIGQVWEHISKSTPRTINGYPTFLSCHLMLKDDWERAAKAIEKELERRKSIEV